MSLAETVLITGASSGLGLELAKLFAAAGSNLVLVARRHDRLVELARDIKTRHSVMIDVRVKDLALPQAPGELFNELEDAGIPVDVLVNNAGFGAAGQVRELAIERQLDMIRVNVLALTDLTRLFLPAMVERGRGGVLNVGSTAAFQPGPYMAVYYASKAYVLHFTEALAEEVRGTGVKVSCLAPGPTETEFASTAALESKKLFRSGVMSSQAVAQAGYSGFRAGQTIVIPGIRNKALAFAVRLVPRAWARRIAGSLQS